MASRIDFILGVAGQYVRSAAVTFIAFTRWCQLYTVEHIRFQLTTQPIYRSKKDVRMSWPGWFTHARISCKPQRSTTVQRNHPQSQEICLPNVLIGCRYSDTKFVITLTSSNFIPPRQSANKSTANRTAAAGWTTLLQANYSASYVQGLSLVHYAWQSLAYSPLGVMFLSPLMTDHRSALANSRITSANVAW